MKIIKICSLILALLMLLGVFASCSINVTETTETEDSSSVSVDDGVYPSPTPYMDDFEGYEFRVLTRGSGGHMSNDILGNLDNSLDAAVYTRNANLKSKYNINISEHKDADWVSAARQAATSGEDTYDMWSFKMQDTAALAIEGLLYDLKEVEYIKLDAPYYDPLTINQGTFSNRLFFVTGDLLYYDDMQTSAIAFNLTQWKQNKLDSVYGKNLYDLVRDGEWTLEKLENLSQMLTKDNGDGTWDANDNYGFVYENYCLLGLNTGVGNDLVKKNAADTFELNTSEIQLTALERIMKFFSSGNCIYKDYSDHNFFEGRALFSHITVGEILNLAQLNVAYGVIPFPKNDTGDGEYRSLISGYNSNCITVCKTVKDVNKTASIIDLLSYESMLVVTPTLRSYLFEGRGVPAVDDLEMIKLIADSKTYEICYVWRNVDVYEPLKPLIENGGSGLSGTMEGLRTMVETKNKEYIDALNK